MRLWFYSQSRVSLVVVNGLVSFGVNISETTMMTKAGRCTSWVPQCNIGNYGSVEWSPWMFFLDITFVWDIISCVDGNKYSFVIGWAVYIMTGSLYGMSPDLLAMCHGSHYVQHRALLWEVQPPKTKKLTGCRPHDHYDLYSITRCICGAIRSILV